MKWSAEIKDKSRHFEIVEETFINPKTKENYKSYTLSAWHDGICIDHDHQDTLQWCQRVALEQFGVPLDAWKRVE